MRAEPALQRAESLLLFELHPSPHLPTLEREEPTREGVTSPEGPFLKPGNKRARKLWVQKARGDVLFAGPLGAPNLWKEGFHTPPPPPSVRVGLRWGATLFKVTEG